METKENIFENENVIQKVYTGVIIALVLVIGLLALSFYQVDKTAKEVDSLSKKYKASVNLSSELRQSSDNLTRMARTYVLTGNKEYLKQYFKVLDIRDGKAPRPVEYYRNYWQLIDVNKPNELPREFGEAKALTELMENAGFTPEELEKLNDAQNLSNELAEDEKKAFTLIKNLNLNPSNPNIDAELAKQEKAKSLLFGTKYNYQKKLIMEPIDEFVVMMESRLKQDEIEAKEDVVSAERYFIGLFILSVLLIIALFYITRKLNDLQLEKTRDQQEQAEEENDQINNSIINILQSVSQLSQKDLTARAPVTEDVVGTVSDSINYLADETGRVMQEVKDVAALVKDSSTKVQSQAQQVTETAEAERENVDNMVEVLYQATETMNQVAELAERTNDAGNKATQVTESALVTVNDTVMGMESIRTTIAETEKRIKRLGERSQEISGIVNLINTISERTHVLALNASMQAAVAGEAGRGFAVVAEEVQRLAESSQHATQQIESLVNNIQIETNETINTVNNTITQVVEGSAQAQRAGEQMKETQEITAQLVEQVKFIAQASDKQKQMSATLLESVQRIGESTELTASQIVQQNIETDNLQLASDRLVETVDVFKLPQK